MFSFRTRLAPITALLLLIATFIFTLMAISSAYWSELRAKANGGECVLEHRGLWRQCVRFGCEKAPFKCFTTVADVDGEGSGQLSSPDLDDWYYSVQALETLAFICCLVALGLWVLWIVMAFCCGGATFLKIIKIITFVVVIFLVIFHFLGVVVWACKDDYNSSKNLGAWKLCWSFALAVVACVLAMVALVFIWYALDSVRIIHGGAIQATTDEEPTDGKKAPPEVYVVETK